MTEIIKQKIVSGCKNPFWTFYIAVMHYGVWLLILLKYAAKQAEKLGHGLTYINLFEKNIEYCWGCRKCLETGECVFKNDDMSAIGTQRLLNI